MGVFTLIVVIYVITVLISRYLHLQVQRMDEWEEPTPIICLIPVINIFWNIGAFVITWLQNADTDWVYELFTYKPKEDTDLDGKVIKRNRY